MTMPRFDSFYRAVTGNDPLPWQTRLARTVELDGWPATIGVPTGLGKTSCLHIAVWHLATQADLPPDERTAPTRIWYVVNRRLLVDAAHDLAQRLAEQLRSSEHPDVSSVADRLARIGAMGTEQGLLHIVRLRGGVEAGARSPDPSQPTVLFATVPMFASRWLFRGYGSSRSMRPIDAAHAGTDSLVLVDEAHLAAEMMRLAEPVAQCDVGDPASVLPEERSRPRFVSLSATADAHIGRFDLDDTDLAHPVVRERLDAAKPTTLAASTKRDLVADLVAAVEGLVDPDVPEVGVVFCNSPRTAREVFSRLTDDVERRLVTGRMRTREADKARAALTQGDRDIRSNRPLAWPNSRTLIVVATQTLEVGADLDFDFLVTETAGVRSVIQRFGRLNRLGRRQHARAVIVHPQDQDDHPVYGSEPAVVWSRLCEVTGGEHLELGPTNITQILGEPDDHPGRTGELLHAHLWEWAKTSEPPVGEAPAELFYAGFGDGVARVSVCWRAWLPGHDEPSPVGLAGTDTALDAAFEVPVIEAETVELPLNELRGFVDSLPAGVVSRAGLVAPDRTSLRRLDRLLPGDLVVLPTDAGGYDEFGWNPDAAELPVLDVSMLHQQVLPLVWPALETVTTEPSEGVRGVLDQLLSTDEELDFDAVAAGLTELFRTTETRGDFAGLVSSTDWHAAVHAARRSVDGTLHVPLGRQIGPGLRPRAAAVRSDAFDELSYTAESVALADHLGTVGELAARIARSLGLRPTLVESVRRAGAFHDLGKADPRFQAWLAPGGNEELQAKSDAPWSRWRSDQQRSGWPSGGRHEALSGVVVDAWLDGRACDGWDPELVMHLVLSHHGWGRPLVPPVERSEPVRFTVPVDGTDVTVIGDLAACDWAQPRRFRELCEAYGYWGLALLEAIVRQADHAASFAAGRPTGTREKVEIT